MLSTRWEAPREVNGQVVDASYGVSIDVIDGVLVVEADDPDDGEVMLFMEPSVARAVGEMLVSAAVAAEESIAARDSMPAGEKIAELVEQARDLIDHWHARQAQMASSKEAS